MFHAVVIMLKGRAGIVGRIDKDAFDFVAKLGLEGFQGEQVVAFDEPVFEAVGFSHAFWRVVGLGFVFE